MIRSLLADRAVAPWGFAFDVEKRGTCRSLNPNGWSLTLPRSHQLPWLHYRLPTRLPLACVRR